MCFMKTKITFFHTITNSFSLGIVLAVKMKQRPVVMDNDIFV